MYVKKVYLRHSEVSLVRTEVSLFQGCPLRGVPLYVLDEMFSGSDTWLF